MKVQRYQILDDFNMETLPNEFANWCKYEDVARLEASHAELLETAKSLLAWYDFYSPNYYNELHEGLRAAIAKAEGEGV